MPDNTMPHSLTLDGRKRLTMTGVTEVVGFDDETVILRTGAGNLLVQGRDLKLKNLSPEGGQVALEGLITALSYEQPRERTGFFRRFLG